MLSFNVLNVENLKNRVAVVAAGIVSPLGSGLEETRHSLRRATDCVTPVSSFDVSHCRCKTAAQIPDQRLLARRQKNRKNARLHRASHMMIAALAELLERDPGFRPEVTVIGTTSGGMSFGENYYRALHRQENLRRSPEWIANYPPQKPVLDAQSEFGISAPCFVIANACASGTNAIGRAFESVRSGKNERVLTGGYDALSELVFVGFDSLQAATPEKCRPFDRNRSGMVLAQPDPSGSGPRRAMEQALQSAACAANQVDYINAHGTATPFNDAAEGKAILELFGRVPVSSTKSMIGHSLGAAGAIEAVICLLALQSQFLPPNINFREPDPDLALNIVANEARDAKIDVALSNSFGFGGTNASVLIRKAVA